MYVCVCMCVYEYTTNIYSNTHYTVPSFLFSHFLTNQINGKDRMLLRKLRNIVPPMKDTRAKAMNEHHGGLALGATRLGLDGDVVDLMACVWWYVICVCVYL